MSEPETMSINVFTNNKESILKSDNSSNEYILKMNEEYNNNNIKLNYELQDLKHVVNNLESENDKNETSIRYMRGMLKNYVELKLLYKSVSDRRFECNKLYNKDINNMDKYNTDMYQTIILSIFIYYLTMIVNVYFENTSIYDIFVSVSILISSIIFSTKYYNLNPNITLNHLTIDSIKDDINKSLTDIKVIEDSNNFLDEYIDNI